MKKNYPDEGDYLRVLSHFGSYSEKGWHPNYLGKSNIGFFGDPGSGENGLRSMGNFIFISSLLASDITNGELGENINTEKHLERAKCALQYMTRSHLMGTIKCADGGKWGGDWQSSWWTTKMALGAKLIWKYLDDEEKSQIEKITIFEASQHLDRVVPTGLYGDTKAEENAWDAEIIATAVALFPGHEKVNELKQKLIEFNMNTLSVAQDHFSDSIVDGSRVKDMVYTTNLYSDFTLDNHGAAHFCYIASSLISKTWSFYALLSNHQKIPESLLYNVEPFWKRAKTTFLGDRFAYIGGKDWARYTYGLYFIVPALVMIQEKLSDTDARTIEEARFDTLKREQADNKDGSFFGQRVTKGRMFGQNAKYETDCFACLGLAYLLHKKLKTEKTSSPVEKFNINTRGTTISCESLTCYTKTTDFFASFSWRTLAQDYPTALFIPEGMDNAAEWKAFNLLGRVRLLRKCSVVGVRSMKRIRDGFIVLGKIGYRYKGTTVLDQIIEFEVDSERNLAKIKSQYIARKRMLIASAEGLYFNIPNDRFNHYSRNYQWKGGKQEVTFDPQAANVKFPFNYNNKLSTVYKRIHRGIDKGENNLTMNSNWVNLDNQLGIINVSKSRNPFVLKRSPFRNTPAECLHYDTLITPQKPIGRPFIAEANQIVLDTKFVLLAGGRVETEKLARQYS